MSLFTPEDYGIIAKQLGGAGFRSPAYERIVDAVAQMLAQDNPGAFDPDTFRNAAAKAREEARKKRMG